MERKGLFPLLRRPTPIRDALTGERTVPLPELEKMKEEKRREWREKGYSEELIAMALGQAVSWAQSMAEAFGPPEQREALTKHNLPRALQVSERWMKGVSS